MDPIRNFNRYNGPHKGILLKRRDNRTDNEVPHNHHNVRIVGVCGGGGVFFVRTKAIADQ